MRTMKKRETALIIHIPTMLCNVTRAYIHVAQHTSDCRFEVKHGGRNERRETRRGREVESTSRKSSMANGSPTIVTM